ncbi:GNAT family N-acetyltransferase [Nocardia sp. NPDC058640]|uniref:GNAT family N-acetyltransferase n=1 Tax=Nocardia sp. NPDC058640 TaxID=3346571 RepID=UPI0036643FB1
MNARTPWAIHPADPHSPAAAALLRHYLAEMITRYYARPTDDAEIDHHLATGHHSNDLTPPTGLLLLAHRDEHPVGCAGIRRLTPHTWELTRMYVHPRARGTGLSTALLHTAETAAHHLGAHTLRLNTRKDLLEARALYARHGYTEIPPYGDDPLADHWFERSLV